VLASGQVDCWGYGAFGELGDGAFYTSSPYGSGTPVAVAGVGGVGTLTGVSLAADGQHTFCALLASDGVDCCGSGLFGELGDGTFYTTGNDGSAVPVAVEDVGGTGTLSGVASVITDGESSFCALLTTAGVDCWGSGYYGELGDGTFYDGDTYPTSGSATPVAVEGIGGIGTLSGVASIAAADGNDSLCALPTGGVDCWGGGFYGQLGDGVFYNTREAGSATPVAVEGVGGVGALSRVISLPTGMFSQSFCSLVSTGGVDCWGWGRLGQLGNGVVDTLGNQGSATPVQAVAT
jgi:alpha-tubulin suppressor-like RCC1 family protein